MSETLLGTLAVIALAFCVLDSFLWMLGGREGKYKRRFIGSAIQSVALNVIAIFTHTWIWQFAASILPEMGSRTMGYSADKGLGKLIPRIIFAVCSLAVGVFLAWGVGFTNKAITVLVCQVIASIVSIILGVKSPLPAAVEEVFVCISLKYVNYMYIFINYVG